MSRAGTSLLLFVVAAGTSLAACGRRTLYELPPPPPAEERRDVSLIPGEEERQSEQAYVEARAAIIELNGLLKTRRYEEAMGLMSQETQTMLAYLSPQPESDRPALATLTEGAILVSGQRREIEPAAMLLAPDLGRLQDAIEGQREQETRLRKEIFALQPDGSARKIVVIKEGGRWVLHRTSIKQVQ